MEKEEKSQREIIYNLILEKIGDGIYYGDEADNTAENVLTAIRPFITPPNLDNQEKCKCGSAKVGYYHCMRTDCDQPIKFPQKKTFETPNLDNHKKQVDMLLRLNNELIKRVDMLRDEIELLKGNANLDNLLELAREEAERRYPYDSRDFKMFTASKEQQLEAFNSGAKFIIDKLKELGKQD